MKSTTRLWDVCQHAYFPSRLSIRSKKTHQQYWFAVQDLTKMLGRSPTIGDLTDDNLYRFVRYLQDRPLAPKTVNERTGRLKALWTWLAKKGHVPLFPTVERVPEPRRVPTAWSEEELRKLFVAIQQEDLPVGEIPGAAFWTALHASCWCTSERITAMLSVRWEWLRGDRLFVDALVRKAQTGDAVYQLWPEVVETLDSIREPERDLIFPWPYCKATLYKRYSRILRRGGLPTDRKHKLHCLRVSHASWVRATTGESAGNLGHASAETTRRHYEDPRICQSAPPRLFMPWRDAG